MKLNENTKLIGNKVILIPYEAKHVEKYHNWMKNTELQELTASEPLTLDEEYEMQKSWRNDEDKCTFLILSKSVYNKTNDEIQSLIGDTNLFIHFDKDLNTNKIEKIAEAEIMIAEISFRGQHIGWEAMLLMMKYGEEILKLDKFIVKINENNLKSIQMFNKMQFEEISRSSVFKEITFERILNSNWVNWLNNQVNLNLQSYKI